ncbi:DUF2625 domain-containing protein [Hymenobacter sediminis]|uniref:DUF2625 domain-containing protein n=1 Tax=Hymenobacter sediminis TaxID=2218621 RepID=UPI000DA6C6EB|nr:DUF2625 domain-containing protein [Hymenobacter sediminis]RPD50209.1 DUF2625 domain-containing protein [Hymenobacter sediminis]
MQFNSFAQNSATRTLAELVNHQDSGWPLVQSWIKEARNPVQILPKDQTQADSVLQAVQVTTRSPMGAIIYETGGLLVDHGWLRILGSGSVLLNRNLAAWNHGRQDGFLLVADDVLGGFFAINGGAFGTETLGKVYYFAPDTLRWENTDMTYSEFLIFSFSGDLKKFYEGLRWATWEQDVKLLDGTQGFSCYPYLFTKEGKDMRKLSRRPVPLAELWTLNNQFRQELNIH